MEIGMEIVTIATVASPLAGLLLGPLLFGIVNRTKAVFGGRRGQPLLQMYFDIAKLLRKGAVYSVTATWILRAGPIVGVAVFATALCVVPLCKEIAPLSFSGDILLVVYLLAMARFFTIVAALDTGSSFEGMGASREAFFAMLIEPVLLLTLFSLAKEVGRLQFAPMLTGNGYHIVPVSLTAISLFIVLLAENCRIPFDDPNTHLELTMIHEVMVLDHGGPDFGLINYAACLKMWLFGLILARVVIPTNGLPLLIDGALTIVVILLVGALIGIVESIMARLKLLHVPQMILAALALSVLSLLFGKGGAL
jgi:formate hydrogenlyase subunit 4